VGQVVLRVKGCQAINMKKFVEKILLKNYIVVEAEMHHRMTEIRGGNQR